MKRGNTLKNGGREGACEPAGFPVDTTRDVVTPADGSCTHPSPATPRKSPPGLSCSGLCPPPPLTVSAERLTGNTREQGAPPTPSIPSAREAGPDARPCADRGDGQAMNGAPAVRTPEVPAKRATADSGHGFLSSEGESSSHRKRRVEDTVAMEELPGSTARLDNEEHREQHRVAHEENVARRPQEIADDQAREGEASPGGAPPSLPTLRGDRRRRQLAPAALGGHQPRSRRKKCGQAICGWLPSAPGVKCVACPGEVVHETTVALCTACHRCLPGGKATHLLWERQQRARAFVQRCQADEVRMPEVLVRNFEPNGGCLCLREDCFIAFFDASGDKKAKVAPRCATCKQQKKNPQKWYKVRVEDQDGMAVDETEGACSGAAHLPPMECQACYSRRRTKHSEAAVDSTSHAAVVKPPRLSPMERVRYKIKIIVSNGGIVDWSEANEWLRQARKDDGEEGFTDNYARTLVRKLFDQVVNMPGSNARVVSGRRGLDGGGDGRKADLLLFPTNVPDQLVADLYVRGLGETGRA